MADSDAVKDKSGLTEKDRIAILAAKLDIDHPGRALRLYKEVEAAARTFSRSASLRPSAKLKTAQEFLENLNGRPNFVPELSSELRPLLGIVEDYEDEELRSDAWRLHAAAMSAVDTLEKDATVQHDQRGGRYSDSRVQLFAIVLSYIYENYVDEQATFTIDKDDHGLSSPFALFGEEAFHQFCPEELNTPGKVRRALQDAVRALNDLEEISQVEVDKFLTN